REASGGARRTRGRALSFQLPGTPCRLLVSHTANRLSKLRAGSYGRIETRSPEREVSEASVRGAARVGHGVPGTRARQDICKQASSMALAIQNLIGPPQQSLVACS